MKHHCHALGCKRACPPAWLMCKPCWSQVPRAIQAEVYRTVKLRDMGAIDHTWAPWWRAQAKAIAHVAYLREPDDSKRDLYLTREMQVADELEARAPETNDD